MIKQLWQAGWVGQSVLFYTQMQEWRALSLPG